MTNPMYVVQPSYAGRGIVDRPVRDFSTGRQPIRFRVDGDLFEALAELPALDSILLTELLNAFDRVDVTGRERFEVIVKFLETVLVAESAERFVARLTSRAQPIGFNRLLDVMLWLVAQYRAELTDDASSDEDRDAS